MEIKQAEFIAGAVLPSQYPDPDLPEYGFIGRSNVGKSSLINMLASRKDLAKTSQTPGKTRQINFFLINSRFRIADLPGYGYAKISKTEREKLGKMIRAYVSKRENLVCLFLLIDSRIPPQKIDLEFMTMLGTNHVPFILVFTKIDKLSSSEMGKNLALYKKELLKEWEYLPEIFLSSSETGLGKSDILHFMHRMNEEFFLKGNPSSQPG